jgi:hypothetical protein
MSMLHDMMASQVIAAVSGRIDSFCQHQESRLRKPDEKASFIDLFND